VELYNLRDDIHEEYDVSKKNPLKVQELQAKLDAWRKEVGAQMPTNNPNYDPARADQGLTGSRRENQ
jgi:arylsulfatase A